MKRSVVAIIISVLFLEFFLILIFQQKVSHAQSLSDKNSTEKNAIHPATCFVCEYQTVHGYCDKINTVDFYRKDFSVCSGCTLPKSILPITKSEACNHMKIYGNKECAWRDNRCQSRFEVSCHQWLLSKKVNPKEYVIHNIERKAVSGDRHGVQLMLPKYGRDRCEEAEYQYRGHGGGTELFEEQLTFCLACMRPTRLKAVSNSCSTFSSEENIYLFARDVQEKAKKILKANNKLLSQFDITLNAHQAVTASAAGDIESSYPSIMSINISEKEVVFNYGICSELGEKSVLSDHTICRRSFEKATCMNEKKERVQYMCCPEKTSIFGLFETTIDKWYPFDSNIEFCSNYTISAMSVCSGEAIEEDYEIALSLAHKQAETCLDKTKAWCKEGGGILKTENLPEKRDRMPILTVDHLGDRRIRVKIGHWWACYVPK